jgi:hypothetical protein
MIGHNGAPTFEGGWVAIARSMRNHPLVGFHLFAKPCDPARGALQPALAFIDLLMECRYEGGFVMNGGRKMEVKRGQLIGAVSWLANRWNWTPMAVRVWLDKLEADAMISRHIPGASNHNKHVGKVATVITLCNYDQYQARPTDTQQTEQQTNSKHATNEQQQYKDNKGTREQGNNTQAQSTPGVLVVNCETISHPNFVIDLQAVFQGAMLIGVPQDEAKAVAEIMAKDWIASNYKPAKPARYVIDELRKIANGKAIQGVRVDRASGKTPGKRMTLAELNDGVDAAYDRNFFGQPKTPRLTHER